MAERRYPDRFRLNLRDPASFDIQWMRDQSITFQLVAWDSSRVGDIQGVLGVGAVTATVRSLPNQGAELLSRACTAGAGGGHEGHYDLEFEASDFASLTFDLGQAFKCLWMDLQVETNLNDEPRTIPVFDGAGRAIFPLRVHQTMGVGS